MTKQGYRQLAGSRCSQRLAPKFHNGDVIPTSVSIYSGAPNGSFRQIICSEGLKSPLIFLREFSPVVCCCRIVKNVVLGTEKRSAIIFGKAIRPKVFGKWTKKP